MFLASQRKLTLEQVRRLSARFQLATDVFMSKEPPRGSEKGRISVQRGAE
jgi:hypothetical protein